MWPVSLWIHLPYQSCCIYSWWPVGAAVTLHLHSSFGGGKGGQWGWGGEWLSEMDSNDNLICLHMKQLFPIFPICAFPWVQSSARRVMWCCSEILGFQLHPLSLLLSTAATSTANLLSIIFCQIEFELQTKKKDLDLRLSTRYKITFLIFPHSDVNLHILTTSLPNAFLWLLGSQCDCAVDVETCKQNMWCNKRALAVFNSLTTKRYSHSVKKMSKPHIFICIKKHKCTQSFALHRIQINSVRIKCMSHSFPTITTVTEYVAPFDSFSLQPSCQWRQPDTSVCVARGLSVLDYMSYFTQWVSATVVMLYLERTALANH